MCSSAVSCKINSSRDVRYSMPSGRRFNSGQYGDHSSTRLCSAPSAISTCLSCRASPIVSRLNLGNDCAEKYNFFPS
uniref:Uncharacterized protein n=1 Tax=Arundo donax TaxID=35708 RepID=A0A0A8ZFG6_ARUDO